MTARWALAKSRKANFGKIFESEGWVTILASLPYGRKKLYNCSSVNSAGSFPGSGGMNSTFNRTLGIRKRSSTHGFPLTRLALILSKGLHHGLILASLR